MAGAAVLLAWPASGDLPTPRLTFGFDQRLESIGNAGLDVPSPGRTTQAVTGLSFGLFSETPRDTLSLTGGTAFRLGDRPQGTISDFDNSRLGLSYRREGGDSEFTVGGTVRRARLETLRSIEDFIDADGELVLPEDFEDLRGEGRRTDYNVTTQLALGQSAAPIGVIFSLGASGILYDDGAAEPDVRTERGGVETRFRFSPVLTGTLGASRERRREFAAVTERRVTDRVDVGVIYALSPRIDLRAGVGYSRVDRTGSETRREEGVVGSFDLGIAGPLGDLGLFVNTQQRETGQQVTGGVRRALELPGGALSGSLGATRLPSGDTSLITTLNLRQDLRDGPLTVNLSRQAVGEDDDLRIRTVASASYTHEINSVSSFGLRADAARSESSPRSNQVDQGSLGLTYNRALTADWSLTSGVAYRIRREENVGTARSPEVFIGLGRSFIFPL
ncbi:MAG: hypothetical protein ACXIUV_05485 [Alkalilacustris sp.]